MTQMGHCDGERAQELADRMLHTYGLDGMLGLLSVNEVDEALLLGIGQVIS